MRPFSEGKKNMMLMQSPTHAFLLKPNDPLFNEAWNSPEFTYTNVRDSFVKPAEHFMETLLLNDEMIQHILRKLLEKVPVNYQPRFKMVFSQLTAPLNPLFLREYLVETMAHDRGLLHRNRPVLSEDEIDHFFFCNLPYFHTYELRERLQKILSLLPGIDAEAILSLYDKLPLAQGELIMSASELQEACKALINLFELRTSFEYDYHLAIAKAAQKLGFAPPAPVIFADTNWVKDEFAFVVSPGTGRLELWRVDYTGSIGYPMSVWKQWLDGSRKDIKWGVYTKPSEYGQS
jgi:hypothetical protein